KALLVDKPAAAPPPFRSKPHDLSDTLELRRLVHDTQPGGGGVLTCFFEYYWAYRFRDTKARHVFDWGWLLLWNWPSNVPPRFQKYWLFCWSMIVLGALGVLGALAGALLGGRGVLPPLDDLTRWAPWVWGVVALLFSWFL